MPAQAQVADNKTLKAYLTDKDQTFWQQLFERTEAATAFDDLFMLSAMRRKALAQGFAPVRSVPQQSIKLAMLGGCTFQPFGEILQHVFFAENYNAETFMGDYDNYVYEIVDEASPLVEFSPEFIFLVPSRSKYKYSGSLTDPRQQVEDEIDTKCQEILNLCETARTRFNCEVILCNFVLPSYFDPGPYRSRTLASEWNFFKALNISLGLGCPSYVHICDAEFLAARIGGLSARDDRAWFESKQAFSADFTCTIAREVEHMVSSLRESSKKVLVVDLDHTLWGGVIGDDQLHNIEIGDTSARGQCYKEFQRVIKDLSKRGVLLAVCSKNEMHNAREPFEKHPEMILRLEDFVSFKANWNPKSQNIAEIAEELNLGLESIVFLDDNPAEVQLVRQQAPGVVPVCLGSDPSTFIQRLKDSRLFEPKQLTHEDATRAEQYKQNQCRMQIQASAADMETYLTSLEMVANVHVFRAIDVPRVAQLVNKTNQFNLTAKRRSEAEIMQLIAANDLCLSMRLTDKFGDLGLISAVITEACDSTLLIDTWVMSCRVFSRGVEQLLMNELVRAAAERGFKRLVGYYVPTAKNSPCEKFYPSMGFKLMGTSDEKTQYDLLVDEYQPVETRIENRDPRR